MGQPISVKRSVADYLLASKKCDLLSLEQLLRMGQLVVSISNLVHALQRERGLSNIFVGSGGERFVQELPVGVKDARQMAQLFHDRLAAIDICNGCLPGSSRLFSGIAYVIHGLEELDQVREDIAALRITPEAIIDGYSELIRGLLAVVFEAADAAADPAISRTLVAMFHLMQGKELAGQERAVGAAGFARGHFDESLFERLHHLIENQERYFQTFTSFADGQSLALWYAIAADDSALELERLRRKAFTAGVEASVDQEVSSIWYGVTTRRIDNLKRVEDRLEASLSALCEERIAEARHDLNIHQDRLEALEQQPLECASFAIFLNDQSLADTEVATKGYRSDCASTQLGRSLADLVQSQSERLQAMSEELHDARAALTERKTIEKAKGLIMKHRKMTEEHAYRFLREVAMAQRRKLSEVAADTLNMAELLR
ncbi:MAG: ANTAR domain-containing protein [Halomonadaceae bacterium]|nr:MAG: ANTAR domain-containing protein [Halomonadaceae bacterium]